MKGNYIKLYRNTLNNPIVMKDADHLAVWVWLLLNVTYTPTDVVFKGERITLKPGQRTLGRRQISEELSISESKVQRILKLFESEQMIEQQTSNKCRLISIVSWNKYQHNEQQNEQPLNNKWTTTEQQLNTNKEIKNIRNKEILYKDFSSEVLEALSAYEEMRKKKKWDFGIRAKKMFLKKLDELSNGDDELKVRLIDEATLRNWRSVYMTSEIAESFGSRYFDELCAKGAKSLRTISELKERGKNGQADTYINRSLKDEAFNELSSELKKYIKSADELKQWYIDNKSDMEKAKQNFMKEFGKRG